MQLSCSHRYKTLAFLEHKILAIASILLHRIQNTLIVPIIIQKLQYFHILSVAILHPFNSCAIYKNCLHFIFKSISSLLLSVCFFLGLQ